MTIWQLHLLNARGNLTVIMAEIRAHARAVLALVEPHLDVPRFDLVVRAGDDIIPDWGIGGAAPAPGVVELVVDPGRVAPEHFQRTLARQLFLLTRWDGPGYGRSLGEALVSEGLAGRFVQEVLGGPADPWDQARPGAGTLKQAATLWARRDYDHGAWFLGRGKMRKWTGYGIAQRLVAAHLAEDEHAALLVHAPADEFRAALRRLMAAEGIEMSEDEEAALTAAEVAASAEAALASGAGQDASSPEHPGEAERDADSAAAEGESQAENDAGDGAAEVSLPRDGGHENGQGDVQAENQGDRAD